MKGRENLWREGELKAGIKKNNAENVDPAKRIRVNNFYLNLWGKTLQPPMQLEKHLE
jgi:hypothetical protein